MHNQFNNLNLQQNYQTNFFNLQGQSAAGWAYPTPSTCVSFRTQPINLQSQLPNWTNSFQIQQIDALFQTQHADSPFQNPPTSWTFPVPTQQSTPPFQIQQNGWPFPTPATMETELVDDFLPMLEDSYTQGENGDSSQDQSSLPMFEEPYLPPSSQEMDDLFPSLTDLSQDQSSLPMFEDPYLPTSIQEMDDDLLDGWLKAAVKPTPEKLTPVKKSSYQKKPHPVATGKRKRRHKLPPHASIAVTETSYTDLKMTAADGKRRKFVEDRILGRRAEIHLQQKMRLISTKAALCYGSGKDYEIGYTDAQGPSAKKLVVRFEGANYAEPMAAVHSDALPVLKVGDEIAFKNSTVYYNGNATRPLPKNYINDIDSMIENRCGKKERYREKAIKILESAITQTNNPFSGD